MNTERNMQKNNTEKTTMIRDTNTVQLKKKFNKEIHLHLY